MKLDTHRMMLSPTELRRLANDDPDEFERQLLFYVYPIVQTCIQIGCDSERVDVAALEDSIEVRLLRNCRRLRFLENATATAKEFDRALIAYVNRTVKSALAEQFAKHIDYFPKRHDHINEALSDFDNTQQLKDFAQKHLAGDVCTVICASLVKRGKDWKWKKIFDYISRRFSRQRLPANANALRARCHHVFERAKRKITDK